MPSANGDLFSVETLQADRPQFPIVADLQPAYTTRIGSAFMADAIDALRKVPDRTINAVVTSPPYALEFKKTYGNADKADYIAWMLPFAKEIRRVLTDDGSLILNIGGSYNKGKPTRSLYHFKLLIELVDTLGFYLAQECFWFNPAKMPTPAEWVNVRRMRIKDSVEYVWWLSKTEWPKANNRNVLKPYSDDMLRLAKRGLQNTTRPSGYAIKASFANADAGGSISANIIEEDSASSMLKFGNNSANDRYTERCKAAGVKIHPARFPSSLPEFFIKLVTNVGDVVLDPFAGSNTTGSVAEKLGRRWISVEQVADYVKASSFRFDPIPVLNEDVFGKL